MDATEIVFLLTPIDSYNLQLSIYRDSITAYQLIIIQKKRIIQHKNIKIVTIRLGNCQRQKRC